MKLSNSLRMIESYKLDRSFFSVCVLAAIVRGAIATENYFGGTNDTSYLDWVKQKGASYDSSVFLPASSTDDSQGTALHWKLEDEKIYIAVAARATGWLALGLAETGGMKGSDVVIYEAATPGQLRDAYILEERVPLTDDCQDWTFVDSFNEGGFLIFEGVRRLVTNDAQDYAVFNDTESVIAAQFIIAAWGDSETVQYHGINRARGSVRWYGGGDEVTLFREKMKTLSDGYFDLLTNNHTIEAVETKYVTFPFPWDTDIVPQGLPANEIVSVIGLEYLVDDNAGVYVHHANLYANICGQQSYGTAIFSWATGGLPFAMPDNAAFLFGSTNSDCIPSFNLTVHYNNPSLVQGIVDNGGLRMYYSLTPREHEMGIMALADGRVYLEGIPVGDGLTQYSYACDASCSDLALDAPVTVIHELFHMHIKGTAAASYHLRDGAVISQSNVNFFDFDQSGTSAVRQQPYQVYPGDSFITDCFYKSENGTIFGFASNEEMCQAFLVYYPAKKLFNRGPWSCIYDLPLLSACNASLTNRVLTSSEQIPRTFGSSPPQCSEKASANSTSAKETSKAEKHPKQLSLCAIGTIAILISSFCLF